MSETFHRFGAVWFYLLGISYCIAFLLWRNDLLGTLPQWWMQVADLPFLFAASLYGGSSVYRNLVKDTERGSRTLAMSIAVPLSALFVVFVVINFMP